jgi:hypothetical protein
MPENNNIAELPVTMTLKVYEWQEIITGLTAQQCLILEPLKQKIAEFVLSKVVEEKNKQAIKHP